MKISINFNISIRHYILLNLLMIKLNIKNII